MKVTKIIYQKVFPLAQYVNEKIGIEIELDDMDDEGKAFRIAKDTVEKWHKEGNPQIQETPAGETPVPVIQVDKEEKATGIYIEDIMSCKSIKVLDAYASLVVSNERLKKAWERRRSQLLEESPF